MKGKENINYSLCSSLRRWTERTVLNHPKQRNPLSNVCDGVVNMGSAISIIVEDYSVTSRMEELLLWIVMENKHTIKNRPTQ